MGPIQAETFEDQEDDGAENGNGNYMVKMKLAKGMPELIPMCGQRVKIHYPGIKKMCKICFTYQKQMCKNNRALWRDYVEVFKENHSDIPI